MDFIENHTFTEIKVGHTAKLTRTLTQNDINLFAILAGDANPARIDEQYAKEIQFHKMIAHGMWSGMLFSTLLGTELPGPGTTYLSQSLNFKESVAVGDTVTVIIKVIKKAVKKNIIEFECKCINQNKTVIVEGIATVIAPTKKIKRKRVDLPAVIFRESDSNWYQQLITKKNSLKPLITAVVHPVDELSLQGTDASAKEGLIIPILIGPEQKIKAAAKAAKIDISSYKIVLTQHSQEAAEKAVAMVREGKVEAIMKGKIHTDELMHPVVDKELGLRTGRRMSHVFAMNVPNYHKPLFLTDAAINIAPDLDAKCDIVQNAIDLFHALGLGTPKVAIISAVETVNEKIPSTLDATALCKMADREQITGGILDGPLGFDLAVSAESAKVKGLHSPVAGDADIIVVPDVESGNMLYKQMTYLAGTEAAGIVLGARVPIILTSRGSGELSRKASAAMALHYARRKKF